MCTSLLKKKDKWCCTAFQMQTGSECAIKKQKKKGKEMDGIVEVCDV